MDRDYLVQLLARESWNVTRAAIALGIPATTLAYQLRRLGILRPAGPGAPVEQHPPVSALLDRLELLRTQGRLICRTYLPGPARAAMLRKLEAEHRNLRPAIRALLGDGEARQGLVRGASAPGAVRPAWDSASTWGW